MHFLKSSLLWLAPLTIAGSLLSGEKFSYSSSDLISRSVEPRPPAEDPWYTAPKGFEVVPPGTILRLRHAPGNMTSIAGEASAAYNILYRTTDSNNKASWAVTTLFVPKSPFTGSSGKVGAGNALLAFAIPYDSYYLNAAPSYGLYDPEQIGYLTVVTDAVARGWFVSVSDYEGPHSSFTAGVQSAHATLDSIRAVKLFALLNPWLDLSPKANTALWGYSGGAIASEWAAELQPSYAPDLHLGGMAIGGMTPSVESVLHLVTGTPFAGLIPSALLGITSQDAAAQKALISDLKETGPLNKTGFLAAGSMTWLETIITFADQNVFDYFNSGESLFDVAVIKDVFTRDGVMGKHGVPKVPVFAYKAIADQVSVVAESDALIDQLCAQGVQILYEKNVAGEHVSEYTNGHARSLAWLDSVFKGSLSQTGCTTRVVNVTDPSGPHIPGSE